NAPWACFDFAKPKRLLQLRMRFVRVGRGVGRGELEPDDGSDWNRESGSGGDGSAGGGSSAAKGGDDDDVTEEDASALNISRDNAAMPASAADLNGTGSGGPGGGRAAEVICWPRECILEASDAMDGTLNAVRRFSLPSLAALMPSAATTVAVDSTAAAVALETPLTSKWHTVEDFQGSNRTRSWRLKVLRAEIVATASDSGSAGPTGGAAAVVAGAAAVAAGAAPGGRPRRLMCEVELFESEIEADSLQTLHISRNMVSLLRERERLECEQRPDADVGGGGSGSDSGSAGGGGSSASPRKPSKRSRGAVGPAAAAAAAAVLPAATSPPSSPTTPQPAAAPAGGAGPLSPPGSPRAKAPASWSMTARGASIAAKCAALEAVSIDIRRHYLGPRLSDRRVAELQLKEAVAAHSAARAAEEAARHRVGGAGRNVAWWDAALQYVEGDAGDANDMVKRASATVRYENEKGAQERRKFPPFSTVAGLRAALTTQLQDVEAKRRRVREMVEELDGDPSGVEARENSLCGKCRADWGQTGPVCRHCRREALLTAFETAVMPYRRPGRDAADVEDGDSGAALGFGAGSEQGAGANRAFQT
ncbi:unnamed protein product, partial [Phaeothamnion confervicola]